MSKEKNPSRIELLAEIARFCEEHGVAESTLSLRALNNGKTVPKFVRGGHMWIDTADKLRAYMRARDARFQSAA